MSSVYVVLRPVEDVDEKVPERHRPLSDKVDVPPHEHLPLRADAAAVVLLGRTEPVRLVTPDQHDHLVEKLPFVEPDTGELLEGLRPHLEQVGNEFAVGP